MLIGREGITFQHPRTPWYASPVLLLFGRPFSSKPQTIPLARVKRLHRWQPEFSGPIWIEGQEGSWHFRLVKQGFPWYQDALLEERRVHFEDLQRAWMEANRG